MFLDPTFFSTQNEKKLTQNFIRPKNSFDKQILNKLFLYPVLDTNFFETNKFFAIFSEKIFLLTFFDPKIYQPIWVVWVSVHVIFA